MNRDWKKLRKSAKGLPTWDSFIPYVLDVLKQGEETTRRTIINRVFECLGIPEELRKKEYSNSESSQSVLENRVGFALTDLYKANAIIRPKRAVYQITENGMAILNEYGDKLTTDILQKQAEYQAYMKELKLRNKRADEKSNQSTVESLNNHISDDV